MDRKRQRNERKVVSEIEVGTEDPEVKKIVNVSQVRDLAGITRLAQGRSTQVPEMEYRVRSETNVCKYGL